MLGTTALFIACSCQTYPLGLNGTSKESTTTNTAFRSLPTLAPPAIVQRCGLSHILSTRVIEVRLSSDRSQAVSRAIGPDPLPILQRSHGGVGQ